MATFTNTNTPQALENGDYVKFTVKGKTVKYHVENENLVNCDWRKSNQYVFTLLGVTGEEKVEMASAAYGYEAGEGYFPEYHENDFAAATRLVLAIYAKIAEMGL